VGKPTLVITRVRMLHFIKQYKDTLQKFVPNLSRYMCTNKYSNKARYDNVIAKTKWCSFYASQCIYI